MELAVTKLTRQPEVDEQIQQITSPPQILLSNDEDDFSMLSSAIINDDDVDHQNNYDNDNDNDHHHQSPLCSESKISNFYTNRSILITGASGFIGKVLIEKLLRTCIGLRNIFLIIRPKRQVSPENRLKEMINSPLFEYVREHKLESRLVVLEGNVEQENFGLSEEDLFRVINEVSVIFHSAATVKFDEPIKQAVAINIAGVKYLIDLCRKLPQLAALVHVSTAYANCDKPEIDEHVYPADMDPEKLISLADWLDKETLQDIKLRLLGKKPNTYTYTKSIAEYLLIKTARDLPLAIFRPSIVCASWREPFPGWIDNVNGPTGIVLGAAKGIIRTMYCQKSYVADIVPVDIVINLMITLGWFANAYNNHKQIQTVSEESIHSLDEAQFDEPDESVISCSDENEDDRSDHELINNKINHQQQHQKTNMLIDEGYDGSGSSLKCPFDSMTGSNVSSSSTTSSLLNEPSTMRKSTINNNQQAQIISSRSNNVSNLVVKQRLSEQTNALLESKFKQFRSELQAKLLANDYPEEYADVPVFHCTSGSRNPITWGRIQDIVLEICTKFPSIETLRYPNGAFTNNKLLDRTKRILLHYIPGYLVDMMTRAAGGKPILVRVYRKFDQAADVLSAFTMNQWRFSSKNTTLLEEEFMSDSDKQLFDFNIDNLNWRKYLEVYVIGVRKYMLKEPMDNLQKARKNLNRIYYRNLSLELLFFGFVLYYIVRLFIAF